MPRGWPSFAEHERVETRRSEEIREQVSDDAKFRSAVASLPKWEPEYDADGRPRPVPFDEGLAMLIPMRGESASKATDQRMVRFGEWLSDYYSEYEPDAEKRLVFVGNMIAEMKQKGISPQLFTVAGLQFLGWWEARKRGKNSDAGKKGQAKQTKATEARISPKKRK